MLSVETSPTVSCHPGQSPSNRAVLRTFQHRAGTGWVTPLDRSLNSLNTLVVALGSPGYAADPAAFADLQAAYPDSAVIGCSTAGEILGAQLFDDSMSVAVMQFARTRLAFATAPVPMPANSRDAGRLLAEQLTGPGLRAVFVLSDGLHVNGSELVRGLNEVLGEQVSITGGLAGDGSNFASTWVLHRFKPCDHLVTAIGFYGQHIQTGHGSRGGWDVFGPQRRITRSQGNVLYELDGKPALALYKQYLAERAAELPASALLFPLRLESLDASGAQLVRTVLSVNENAQTMTFAGDVPQGSAAQLMRANFDRLISAAGDSSQAAFAAADSAQRSAVLSIAVSCVGRRLVLGERTEEELEAAAEVLGPEDQQIGFYSYGELSPFNLGRCELHNQTMTLTTFCEN
jgi:hypothetical protein